MFDPAHQRFTLGDWVVDAPGNRLLRGDEVRPLRHKAMALLVLLARHPGDTVSRDDIVTLIWDGNQFIAPKAINTAVWTIRQALGDDPDAPRYLETVAKKGYRLIAPVAPAPPLTPPAAPAPGASAGIAPAEVPSLGSSIASTRWLKLLAWGLSAGLGLAGLGWWLERPSGWGSPAQDSAAAGASAPAPLASPTPLTQTPGQEYLGQLSPDGEWLAFAWWQGQGAGRLYLRPAAALDAQAQALSPEGAEVQGLAWSPDGQSIAYVASQNNAQCSLWVYHRKTARHTELARCLPLFTPTVDWSPDGRWIAFTATADGVSGLFLIAPDGTGQHRLTVTPPAAMADHQPTWSPDGRRLAFARQDPADGSRDLHEVSLDGHEVQRLSHLKLYTLHGLTHDATGQGLIFSTTRQDTRVLLRWDRRAAAVQPLGLDGSAPWRSANGTLVYALLRAHVSIARLDWRTGTPERHISSVANDRTPDVGANGTVFVSQRSGHAELWFSDTGASEARRLTQIEGVAAAPALSPDGGQVAFLGSCGPGKRFGLCLLNRHTAQLQVLSADAALYGRPSWQPDGKAVWVSSNRSGSWQLWRFGLTGQRAPGAAPTAQPPGRAAQWAAKAGPLVYQPRFSSHLQVRDAAGRERTLNPLQAGETLVDWRLGPRGLVVLTRGSRERFRLIDLNSGQATALSTHPLGTFPELASFALAPDGRAWVEVSNTAVADLMQLP